MEGEDRFVRARLGQRSRKPLSLAIALACGWAAMPAPLTGQQTQQAQQGAAGSQEHVVRRGDTLWDIARAYLKNPFLWPAIYDVNREVVENPHWIYPNERLVIPPVQVTMTDSGGVEPVVPAVAPGNGQGRTRFYTERAPARDSAAATVLEVVQAPEPWAVSPHEHHSAPYLADTASLGTMGRIISLEDPAAEGDLLPPAIRPYDRVFIGELSGQRAAPGDTLVAVRYGRSIERAGRVIEPVALLRVDEAGASVLTARVVKQFSSARVGDAVLPLDPVPAVVRGVPADVSGGAEGHLLAFLAPEPMHATSDRGFVDLGRAQGIGLGDELIAYLPAREIDGAAELLPPTIVATLRVVRVRDNSATVRVVGTRNTVLGSGLPVRIVRKMQ